MEKLNDYIFYRLGFYKIVFALFYGLFVLNVGDKLAFPMAFMFILTLAEKHTALFGIVGLASLVYLSITGIWYYHTRWNYKLTIASTSSLLSMLSMPVYYAYLQKSAFVFACVGIALLLGGLIIYGSLLHLRFIKEEMEWL
ncbi:MAG: hypothetical protein EOP48_15760 [Sphingobacteriales bacterium]|nr:MAG: hypothetical protein EOP48_15760 [Sphingobacteriales bacterium]